MSVHWLVTAWCDPQRRPAALRSLIDCGLAGLILLAACSRTLIQLTRREGGDTFAAEVWQMQVTERLDESGKPFWYYLQLGLYRYLPVMPLALLTLIAWRRELLFSPDNSDRRQLLWLAGCGLSVLIGLSIPNFKRAYYVVPMVPFLAAIAAFALIQAAARLRWMEMAYRMLVGVLPGLMLVVVLLCQHLWQKQGYWPDVSLPGLILFFVGLQLVAFAKWRSAVGVRRLLTLSGAAFAAQWLMLVAVVEPIQDVECDTRGFVTHVEGMRAQQLGPLVFFWHWPRQLGDSTHDELGSLRTADLHCARAESAAGCTSSRILGRACSVRPRASGRHAPGAPPTGARTSPQLKPVFGLPTALKSV